MEIKKSPKADLERKNSLWFFIALGINISIFVALLECSPSESDVSVEKFEKNIQSMAQTTEMIAAEKAAPAVIEKKIIDESAVSEEIEVVDDNEVTGELKLSDNIAEDTLKVPDKEEIEKPLERNDVVTDLKLLEEIPSYPGGMSQFVKWLTRNLKYPENARKNRLQGVVLASFVVEKNGSISDLKIARALQKDCDEEVLRVLKKMDKWTPGKRNGEPCRTLFCIPVEFKL